MGRFELVAKNSPPENIESNLSNHAYHGQRDQDRPKDPCK